MMSGEIVSQKNSEDFTSIKAPHHAREDHFHFNMHPQDNNFRIKRLFLKVSNFPKPINNFT